MTGVRKVPGLLQGVSIPSLSNEVARPAIFVGIILAPEFYLRSGEYDSCLAWQEKTFSALRLVIHVAVLQVHIVTARGVVFSRV
jgi:hypothetical protein